MLWDDLVVINDVFFKCDDDIAIVVASKEKLKLIQFLLGSNETYSSIRSNLLMRQPLSSLTVSYLVLLQKENQHNIIYGFGGNFTTLYYSIHGNSCVDTSSNYRGRVNKSSCICAIVTRRDTNLILVGGNTGCQRI